MRLRLGTKLLRSPTTITNPSLQSVCSNTLLSLSKTNPNHLNTYSAINHFRRFSSQFTTPPSPGSSVLEKIYGFVSNPVIVKKLLSYALVKGSGKGLGGDSIIAFLRAQLPKPFFEVQNRRWWVAYWILVIMKCFSWCSISSFLGNQAENKGFFEFGRFWFLEV